MDQEAANELVDIERDKLVASVKLVPVILPLEGHVRCCGSRRPIGAEFGSRAVVRQGT
jgi:hypothetical protein